MLTAGRHQNEVMCFKSKWESVGVLHSSGKYDKMSLNIFRHTYEEGEDEHTVHQPIVSLAYFLRGLMKRFLLAIVVSFVDWKGTFKKSKFINKSFLTSVRN